MKLFYYLLILFALPLYAAEAPLEPPFISIDHPKPIFFEIPYPNVKKELDRNILLAQEKMFPWEEIFFSALILLAAILAYFFAVDVWRRNFLPPKKSVVELKNANRWLSKMKKNSEGHIAIQFWVSLSSSVRSFLDENYEVPALCSTSEESINAMEQKSIQNSEQFKEILLASDRVKFAAETPSFEFCLKALKQAQFLFNTNEKKEK